MKLFLLGHVSAVTILLFLFILLIILDDVPRGYRWLAAKSMVFGVQRLGKQLKYRFNYWVVNGQTAYSFNHMIKLVNEGYTQNYKNISVKYLNSTQSYEVRTVSKTIQNDQYSRMAVLKPEKVFLRTIWGNHGKQEKHYTNFLRKLNNIDDE